MQSPRKIKFITLDPKKAGQAGQPYISTTAMDARFADPPASAMGGGAPTGEATNQKNLSYIKEYFFTGSDADKIIKYITSDTTDKDVLKYIADNFGKQSFSSHKIKEINTSIDDVIETDTHVITYNENSGYVFVYRKDKPLLNEGSNIITEAEDEAKALDDKLDKPGYIPSPDDVELAAKIEEPPEDEKSTTETEPESEESKTDEAEPKAEEGETEAEDEDSTEEKVPAQPDVEVSKVFKKGDAVYFISKNKEKIRGKIEELVTTQSDSWYNFVSDDGDVDLWTKANTFNHISSAIVKPTTSQT